MATKVTKSKKLISVKVARSHGKVIPVRLAQGKRTVEDALKLAGLSIKDSEEAFVNGEEAEMEYELENGDRVILVKNVEGGI